MNVDLQGISFDVRSSQKYERIAQPKGKRPRFDFVIVEYNRTSHRRRRIRSDRLSSGVGRRARRDERLKNQRVISNRRKT